MHVFLVVPVNSGAVGTIDALAFLARGCQRPPLRHRHLEHRSLGGDPQIGALDQHEAAAHRKAVDRGNHRLLQGAGHERVLDVGPLAAGLARGQRLLHVLAGAEAAAGPGEDGDFQFVAVAKLGPGLGQLGAHLVAERIEPLGPVHPHHQDLSVALGLYDGHVLPF